MLRVALDLAATQIWSCFYSYFREIMQVLITGVAGFIGYHLAQRLLNEGIAVYGIDNLNPYYDVNLKQNRLNQLKQQSGFTFQLLDLSHHQAVIHLFQTQPFEYVINLAAQAGVRYSLVNPMAYIDSNIVGFVNLLEGCRHCPIKHLVFASSSSVYGANRKVPFSTHDNVDHPVSLYAATKKSNELIAHTYSHLYNLPATGLRFFTVYGPWGRPDMAYFKFVRAIESGEPIDVYNFGDMQRDFTYIDDVVEGIVRVMYHPPQPTPEDTNPSNLGGHAACKVYNIGNNKPVALLRFIEVIEQSLGKEAKKNLLPIQPGDVVTTYADVDELMQEVGFRPDTPIETGIPRFVQWYRDYYGQ
jgi:UDP-glucuronate 4-epimerase